MRLLKDNKGQIRTIEAFFAAILMLSALTLIPAAQEQPSDPTVILSSMAQNKPFIPSPQQYGGAPGAWRVVFYNDAAHLDGYGK